MGQPNDGLKDITIIDIAQEAGVSYSMVSRVVNNKEHVKPEKRERVLQAMARLGYVANQQARSLAGGRSNVIGLLVRDLTTGYTGEIIRGIDLELTAQQYDLMLYTTHNRKTREMVHVTSIVRGLADGLLIILPTQPESYINTLRQRNYPFVLIDYQGQDTEDLTVVSANQQGAYQAMQYLIEAGHRRIGFITGTLETSAGTERLAGYKVALANYGLPIDPTLIQGGDFLQPSGYQGAQKLLDLEVPPSVIFASNDVQAFGVMEAVRDRGLRIPQDMSIVGFDDIPQATQVHPPLTTIQQPLEDMGRVATRLLIQRLQDPHVSLASVVLSTKLVIRQSSTLFI